jgi:hypothetical protein
MNYTNNKKILQISDKRKIDNFQNYLSFSSIIDNNINFDCIYFSDEEQRMFIKNYCNEYLDTYDLIKETDLKNMIFVCNYLYLNGGYYVSFNIILNKNIIDISDKNYYVINNNLILELLFCEKENKNIMSYLDKLLYLNANIEVYEIFKDFEKLNTEYYIIKILKENNIISNNYIKNVFTINQYKFLIDSQNEYMIEYLNLDYYKLESINNIESDLEIIVINNETSIKKNIIINESNKHYIFKVN